MPPHVCGVVLLDQVKLLECSDRLSVTSLSAGNLGDLVVMTML